jgi:hypothetical protein
MRHVSHIFGLAAVCALVCAAQLIFVGTAHAQSKERFRYEVTWGDAQVASMRLDVGCPRGSHVPAALIAKSTGVANQIHSFDIRLDSFFVPGGRSLEGRTFITEEGEPRRFKSRFKTAKSVRVEKTFRGETSKKAFELPGAAQDLLSWMLNLRSAELTPASAHRYWVWDGWKLSRIDAVVGESEAVATGQGARRAFAVELFRTVFHHGGPEKFKPRGDREKLGKLWLGTDAERTPLAMTFDAPVGVARVSLQSATRRACERSD